MWARVCSRHRGVGHTETFEDVLVHFGPPVILAIAARSSDGTGLDVVQVLEDFAGRKKHDFVAKVDHAVLQLITGHTVIDLKIQSLLLDQPAIP
ncbi:hypothetical protein D3C81_1813090 [compost metagenome]